MRFSFNSLNEFINLKDFYSQPDKLANQLSDFGFEVERWDKKQIQNIVTAEVLTKKPHPRADKLKLCEVTSQANKTHSIVCGADNFQVGDKVVLALPGAVLPTPLSNGFDKKPPQIEQSTPSPSHKGFKIQTRKIRGEISEGMLLSLSEIGLAVAKDTGIIVLPRDTKIGLDFADYIGLNDIIFEIDILPHRPDCLSHIGLSRELACLFPDLKKSAPSLFSSFVDLDVFIDPSGTLDFKKLVEKSNSNKTNQRNKQTLKTDIEVEVRQQALCPRYTGQAIYGVTIAPSPLWLRACLHNLGLKSINNIVDITNYCLMQWGQPLHAFDLDRIDQKIIVDFSQKGEKFLSLDNQEISLTGKELCIRDKKSPLALAGVIGGLVSGIQANTKNIFVESACFAPSQVRQSSKRFYIETDSSYRFSRGVCSETTLSVLQKAVAFMQNLAGGEIAPKQHDIKEKPALPKPITIKPSYVERRLGMSVSPLKFQNRMQSLGCRVASVDVASADVPSVDVPSVDVPSVDVPSVAPSSSKTLDKQNSFSNEEVIVTPPVFRFDLKIKEDLVEEYARLESYNKIPEAPCYVNTFPKTDHKEQSLLSHSALIMVHEGFYQAINHSFISQSFSNDFLLHLFASSESNPKSKNTEEQSEKSVAEKANSETSSVKGVKPRHYKITDPLLEGGTEDELSSVLIQNPLSQEHNMMRTSLLPSLFKNAQKNLHSHVNYGRLFELGKVFFHQNTNKANLKELALGDSPYREDIRLGLIAWGHKQNLWEKHQNHPLVYELKTAISTLLDKLCFKDYEWVGGKAPAFMHPFQYMVLKVKGQTKAYIGSLNPAHAEHYKIRTNLALGEMNMSFLLNIGAYRQAFKKLSPFPAVERDLTFLLPKDFPAGNVQKAIKKTAGSLCHFVKIFDIYEGGDKLKEDEKAVSFRLHLQSDTKTLTEKVLAKLQTKLIKEITTHYPAKLQQE